MGLAIFHYFGLGKESPPQALGYSEQLFTCHEKVFWSVILGSKTFSVASVRHLEQTFPPKYGNLNFN